MSGEQALVVRIARRPVSELPRPMTEELAGIALVPAGVGPRAVLLEESPEPLGAPFVVTSYVPGHEVEPADWTDELLAAHARQLAALHARPFDRCGDVIAGEADRVADVLLGAQVRRRHRLVAHQPRKLVR
jgi:aminoglycoside phosphotransferase (APT) family kinase protein